MAIAPAPGKQARRQKRLPAFEQFFAFRRLAPPATTPPIAFTPDSKSILFSSDISGQFNIWRVHGVDRALREAWERGAVVAGSSAGGICWFEGGVTDSFGPELAPLRDGVGLLAGTFCPHYDSEHTRRATYHRLVGEGLPAGYAADDGVGLHFHGPDLVEAVRSRAGGRAFRVEHDGDAVTETALPVRPLD